MTGHERKVEEVTELNETIDKAEETGKSAIGAVAIEVFEAAPDLDAAFPERWRERAGALRPVRGFRRARLHRALLPESRFAFVAAVEWESAQARDEAMAGLGANSRAAVYSVIDEVHSAQAVAGAAAPGAAGAPGVTMVNAFELPADRVDEFLDAWRPRARRASEHAGFLGYRMHRAVGPTRFPLVNIAHYASVERWRALQADPEFRARKAVNPPYASANPALFEVAAEIAAASAAPAAL
jgi:heme-degrading monooxygenase HmoA